ncbi:RNA-binding protein [Candidatus Roizmanbacteria bacterium CG_4_10_14_0_2_um_filter_36_35]|uniref:RNA-binding protein n=4 Tax=Candidatus Roizmaniibacteriota TaxID=1752723 RepID=A0A2M7BXK6_9BACT|nr:MAG: RNA-binding protein [Candidatus Roizmanbacteria bacterium CG11_big_fil_rev_8_21_14_0_20_35_14]PIV11307.1 MAG: RNA-binding protein [Candidatus Roizmanbacteria bacterium CG03_land_8_20_14_0_80_35_26]PIZ68977.1 MAG: RNA-binding protein [Candidatus Roizmanbacteria bacterium CG_4_10_14_0_2_um_filter_36_35]PJC32367.1 MAG: RNA-binding protein [Candidatus Roizmanbacteria bacterium CG_4_9_14_0_2_um_filter_36_12]PJC80327.1 MAG: RNA-binding protein [Candidatus Roizmanbacteria bacterium CG_4_8_14_3
MDKKKLYVGNLPWTMTNDSLKEMFASYGEVVEAVIITDRMSGRSKGFGFVTFADEAAAEKAAAEMNGKTVEERQIVVNVARPREERPAGGGYRGGGGGFRRDNRPRF